MHSGFQRDPTVGVCSERRLQGFGCGGNFLLLHDAPSFIENAVAAGAIAQVQADVKLDCEKFLLGFVAAELTFLIAGLL
jgi:hypothetical protein